MPVEPGTASESEGGLRFARRRTPEERAEELLALEREAEREERAATARTLISCFAWVLIGLALMSYAVHTTDLRVGGMAYWAGLLLGNGGVLLTLIGAFLRSMRD